MTTIEAGVTNASLFERARQVTAAEIYDIGTRFPSIFTRSEGSWLYDVEGKRILDVTAASGALLFGNCQPEISAAICDYIRDHGTMFASTLSPTRLELAERLCERYPAGEKAVFCKTGSEATTAAIRMARAATGRELVLSAGFHGWHDWQRWHTAFGLDALNRIVGFGYSQTALERFLSEFAAQIAAVIVTPEPAWLGADDYRRMSDACARHGVLFILDEVITALRYGSRGLNGTGHVPADAITISKGLANGHALAAVLGRRDLIDCYDAAGVAGTYTREVPPMAAALATLDLLEDGSVHEHCERMGRLLMAGMRDVLATVGIPAHICGPPMMFDLVAPSEQLAWDIYRAAYDYGAWFEDSGTHMVTAAFGEAEVEHALSAFEQGARRVAAQADVVGGELPQSRKDQFAAEAFGGRLHDDDLLLSDIEQALCQIGGARG